MEISSADIEIKLVKDGKLLEKAQELRMKIFFKAQGRDQDKFDPYCMHVVALDKKTGKVIGNYRLLLGADAQRGEGFYAETKFDISNIKKNCQGQLLEMGRACVDEDYRKLRIVPLMWRAINAFIKDNDVSYILGSSSVYDPTPQMISMFQRLFKEKYYSQPELRVYPREARQYPYDDNPGQDIDQNQIIQLLPALMQSYLKMGAVVCGEPVKEPVFNTAVFFMLLKTKYMNSFYKNRFL
ncbi:MAG: GNAT family N-acetyltransferase [Candidatus Omnitrophica bacterium]|nr:GNAT family N-acetyltransferase [Candidatus Omnitrophota bacterium]